MYLAWSGGIDRRYLGRAGGGADGNRQFAVWTPGITGAVKVYTKRVPNTNTFRLLMNNSKSNALKNPTDEWQLTDLGPRDLCTPTCGNAGTNDPSIKEPYRWAVWEIHKGLEGATTLVSIDDDGYISALRGGKTRYLSWTSTKQKRSNGNQIQAGAKMEALSDGRMYGVWSGKLKLYFSQDPPS